MVYYHGIDIFQIQPDAVLSQDNPDSGVKYTVLDTVYNARIISIEADVTWTVGPTPLEIYLTIDGQAIRHYFTDPVTATEYFCQTSAGDAANIQYMTVTALPLYRTYLTEGRSVKVEEETTGGTVQNLSARVKYALRR